MFGLRWLLNRFGIFPNAYYNHLKNRKAEHCRNKAKIVSVITETYHARKGIPGYRLMTALLKSKEISISATTCHKYMNAELRFFSVTRRHKPGYRKGAAHKVFENLLKQNFNVDSTDKIWCTDFTYIPLTNGSMRYNCTIIDLHDRSVIASVSGRNITAELGIQTLSKAISQHPCEEKLFSDIENYVLLWYNSVKPHSFNNGLNPWQKRLA